MKLQIVAVLAVVAVACAAPQRKDADAQVIRNDVDFLPNGGFNSASETDNGIKAQASGQLKQVPDENNKPVDALVIQGQYSYVDNEGKQHNVIYVADENGFQPQSEDIPRQAPNSA
ncbi:insect cuticle protein domain-containing protein [Phthorimaea operculella]|nr:insect cuticle protein domain-containing protein [Phthorimaea operculella]